MSHSLPMEYVSTLIVIGADYIINSNPTMIIEALIRTDPLKYLRLYTSSYYTRDSTPIKRHTNAIINTSSAIIRAFSEIYSQIIIKQMSFCGVAVAFHVIGSRLTGTPVFGEVYIYNISEGLKRRASDNNDNNNNNNNNNNINNNNNTPGLLGSPKTSIGHTMQDNGSNNSYMGALLKCSLLSWLSDRIIVSYWFSRVPIIRYLEIIGNKIFPFFVKSFRSVLGVESDQQMQVMYKKQQESIVSRYANCIDIDGAVSTVLSRNIIQYTTPIILDQIGFLLQYLEHPSAWRKVIKAHLTSLLLSLTEVSLGLLMRIMGAKVGHRLIPSMGFGAFWGECLSAICTSLFIAKASIYIAIKASAWVDNKIPNTIHDEEAIAEEAQAAAERDRLREETEEGNNDYHEGDESLYCTLGVTEDATDEDIKKRYKVLALQVHPDKNTHLSNCERAAMAEKFKKVSLAYHILKDSTRRSKYDRDISSNTTPVVITEIMKLPKLAQVPILLSCIMALGIAGGVALYGQSINMFVIATAAGNGLVRSWREYYLQ